MNTTLFRLARICVLAALLTTLATAFAFAVNGSTVPWKGIAAGSVVAVTPTSTGVQLTVHASGHATQLGHFDRVEELLLDPATGSFTGSIVFVAANHDELHVTVVGGFVSPTTAVGTYTFAGGTGRFVDASGTAAFEAVTPDGVQMVASFAGSISTVGE